MSAVDIQHQLHRLQAERALATVEGLDANAAYVEDLDQEIWATHHAYVGAAVAEIAALRADLSGPLTG